MLSISILRLVVVIPFEQVVSPLTSRRSVRPGLDNHFLLGGLSSGSRLLREGRADRHHIGGQYVEFTLYRRLLLPYCILEPRFKLSLYV